jgi:transcriptional regulator with XRE-family HTH domain
MSQSQVRQQSNIRTFGQAISLVRVERGLTHREVADRVGKTKSLVRDWENNLAIPNTQTMKRLYATFPQLRYFTHLLPMVATQQYLDKIGGRMDELGAQAIARPGTPSKVEDRTSDLGVWFPPISQADDPVPDELSYAPKLKTFGEYLRYLRLREGLDISEVAELLRVSDAAVSHWELNRVNPIIDHLNKLTALFPALKNAPQPESKDMAKPDNRVNGYTPEPHALRAVPTAFDAVASIVPAPPPQEVEVVKPAPAQEVQKTRDQLLAEAGAAYANLISEKALAESDVLELEIELEAAKQKLAGMDDRVKAAHQKIIDVATKL